MGEPIIVIPPITSLVALNQYEPVLSGIPLEEEVHESATSWEDTFFDGEVDVVAVFDYDYAKIETAEVRFRKALLIILGWITTIQLCWIGAIPFFYQITTFFDMKFYFIILVTIVINWLYIVFLIRVMRGIIQWRVYSQHLCVTQDGIKLVQDKRKRFSLCVFSDKRQVQTVTWDNITRVTYEEHPKFTIPLPTISVSYRGKLLGCWFPRKLVIQGLKEPVKFKQLVEVMLCTNSDTSSLLTCKVF
jgi:hypothetical protein